MHKDAKGLVHPQDAQVSENDLTARQGPRWNALKHGRRSRGMLLPGDDPAEFEALRQELYETYRPLTPRERRCVERMARCEWRMERWERWEVPFNATLDELLEEAADGPTAQCVNPDVHHWQHRSEDCTKQEMRFERASLRMERRLLALQELRRNRLLVGRLAEPPSAEAFRAPPMAAAPAPVAPMPIAAAVADGTPASAPVPVPDAVVPTVGLSGLQPVALAPVATHCSSGPIQKWDQQQETIRPQARHPHAFAPLGMPFEQSLPAPGPWGAMREWAPPGSPAFHGEPAPMPWVPLRVATDVSSLTACGSGGIG